MPMAKSQRESPGGQHQSHGDSSPIGGDTPVSSMAGDCLLKLDTLCIYEDDRDEVAEGTERRKEFQELLDEGLRQFSVIVCKKIEGKGRTTYSEVADEIIAEFSSDSKNNSLTLYDEKNIRRRVYDAFNVLLAIGVIARDKKVIRWNGFPNIGREWEKLVEERLNLLTRIQEKVKYLQELEEQFVGLKNLMLRNEQLQKSDSAPPEGIALPFILVQTCPQATVEIEISEDRHLVHFDFNGTPFAMHDDAHVLKEMRNHLAAGAPHDTCLDSRSKHGKNKSYGATFSWSAKSTAKA